MHRFPLTFVVKSLASETDLRELLRVEALRKYGVEAVVARYMQAVEEVINIPRLLAAFSDLVQAGFSKLWKKLFCRAASNST